MKWNTKAALIALAVPFAGCDSNHNCWLKAQHLYSCVENANLAKDEESKKLVLAVCEELSGAAAKSCEE